MEKPKPPLMLLDDRMEFTDAVDQQTMNEALAAVYLKQPVQIPMSQLLRRLERLAGTEPLERWMFQILVQELVRRLGEEDGSAGRQN